MTPNEADRETEQLKQLIRVLARRGYICKSELCKILSGCRANTFLLGDIEALMYSIIDESVTYIDDTAVSDPFRLNILIQEELKKAGYRDLFQFLSISEKSDVREIRKAYDDMKSDDVDSDLYGRVGEVIKNDVSLDIYRYLYLAGSVLEEISLRKQFGLLYMTEDEVRQIINTLVADLEIPFDIATDIVNNYMIENDIVISKAKNMEIAETNGEELDEFLIPIQSISEQNKKGRGVTNGRR